MKSNTLKWTRLQNRIFNYLCLKAGISVNQNEIAKALKVSPTAVSKALKRLNKETIIIYKKYPNINLTSVELNRDNQRAILLKRVQNLKNTYESGLINTLSNKYPGTLIILFGSYSYGTDTHNSDIDIAIIGSKEKSVSLEQFEKFLEKKIVLQFYNSLNNIHKNLRSNIINGIVLKGVIEL
ncbi:nucleotidyltransferase domain-containing protein [Candidatus Pacearchaeota archaeon]|nr:nucleotidyltransferase domain-containing protein [Candidatus Pacearchaeota archaeon]